MSLRQGPQRDAAHYDELLAAGFNLPLDRQKPAPAVIAVSTLADVTLTGAFPSRMKAEYRALALSKKDKKADYFAHLVNSQWCVCKRIAGQTIYVDG